MLSSIAFLAALATPATAEQPKGAPKHVVFFMIDDFGFADASYKSTMYNGTAPPPTPNIDALAMAGIRLESHYVNKLCSPTRTAFLSGRYAYTNGQDDGVIVDGQNIDMPLNLKTVADRLAEAGWDTSNYGKWDAGMTTWGSTPTCRGFGHFNGFYSAASDYFTHTVGPGYDYHCDLKVDDAASGIYTTHKVTSAVQAWITEKQAAAAGKPFNSFAYVAHEGVHGPLEVPLSYVEGPCMDLIPADRPTRRIYCGMVRAVDESVKNITATYAALGILNDTLFVLSGDNGGIPDVGGNNFPLRGNKATTFEGGVRSIAFVSGAGIAPSLRGTVSHEIFHVTDWLPTIAGGIAGLDLSDNTTGRPCPACTRPVAPLDGFDQWEMFSVPGTPSQRTEVLLDLQALAENAAAKKEGTTRIPGSGAIRVGKWKLLNGHNSVFPGSCTLRAPVKEAKNPPIPIPSDQGPPWCPFGWTPPPRADGAYMQPQAPPGSNCTELPCQLAPDSGYVAGQTLLFDVVSDPFERVDVAAANPDVVAKLLARLAAYNNTHCGGTRCMPDDAGGAKGVPVGTDGPGGMKVWYPWRGNPDPAACDTNRTPPDVPANDIVSSLNDADIAPKTVTGWCWDRKFAGGGVPPMTVRVSVDSKVVVAFAIANITRPGVPGTGAPNAEHGFSVTLPSDVAAQLAGPGTHALRVEAYTAQQPTAATPTIPLKGSPACYKSGRSVQPSQCAGVANPPAATLADTLPASADLNDIRKAVRKFVDRN